MANRLFQPHGKLIYVRHLTPPWLQRTSTHRFRCTGMCLSTVRRFGALIYLSRPPNLLFLLLLLSDTLRYNRHLESRVSMVRSYLRGV